MNLFFTLITTISLKKEMIIHFFAEEQSESTIHLYIPNFFSILLLSASLLDHSAYKTQIPTILSFEALPHLLLVL